jgi:hypothetical protein
MWRCQCVVDAVVKQGRACCGRPLVISEEGWPDVPTYVPASHFLSPESRWARGHVRRARPSRLVRFSAAGASP